MCLDLKDPNQKKPNTAKRDIYCLKVVEYYDPKTGRCLSYYRGVNQQVGKLMKSELGRPSDVWYKSRPSIQRGLHAIRLGHALLSRALPDYITVMLAKIPKGSKYYEGFDGDIVADQMVLVEPLVSNTDASNLEVNLGPKILRCNKAFELANQILEQEGYQF